MTAAILFYISLIGIVGMIYLKARRLRRDARSRFAHLTEKVDIRIRNAYRKTRIFIGYFNRKSAVALVQWIAYYILSWVKSAYLWLHDKAHAYPHSKKVIDMVQGKGEVNKIGGASFYLKRIAPEESTQTK